MLSTPKRLLHIEFMHTLNWTLSSLMCYWQKNRGKTQLIFHVETAVLCAGFVKAVIGILPYIYALYL